MNPIRTNIQNAIQKADARSESERNRIYLAARDAIERLPAEQSEPAMAMLFDVIKEIETEFAQHDLGEPEVTPVSFEEKFEPTETNFQSSRTALSVFQQIPWNAVSVTIGLFFLMGVSIYLLFAQFEPLQQGNGSFASEKTESVVPAEKEFSKLFSYNAKSEISNLSSIPDGTEPLRVRNDDNPEEKLIALIADADVYTQNPVRLEPEKLYLMRFKLKVEPVDNQAEIFAGLSSLIPDPQTPDKNATRQDFFVYKGKLIPSTPKENESTFLFSGLTQWEEIAEKLKLNETGGLVRPVIVIRGQSNKTRVWLTDLSFAEL